MPEPAETVRKFFETFPKKTFEKGEILIQAEEEPAAVYCLLDGRINQYDITPTGNIVVVNVYKPGAFFPMAYAINHTPNHYFFEAATAITVRVAPPEDVVEFLHANPEVTFDLLSRVYRGVDGVLRRMAQLMGGDAKSRLHFELLNAAYRFGQPQPDGTTFVPLVESDIGNHSGLARETVNRQLQDLKQRGLIGITRQGMTVYDMSKLEAAVDDEL